MLKDSRKGIELDLSGVHEDEFTALLSESASRVVVATGTDHSDAVIARAAELGIPATTIGTTDDSGEIRVGDVALTVRELVDAWSATLPDLFGHAVGANSVVE